MEAEAKLAEQNTTHTHPTEPTPLRNGRITRLRVLYWGPYYKGVLLFGGSIFGALIFVNSGPCSPRNLAPSRKPRSGPVSPARSTCHIRATPDAAGQLEGSVDLQRFLRALQFLQEAWLGWPFKPPEKYSRYGPLKPNKGKYKISQGPT